MSEYAALDDNDINDLLEAMNNKDKLLALVNEIAIYQYYLGYDDGYERGESSIFDNLKF